MRFAIGNMNSEHSWTILSRYADVNLSVHVFVFYSTPDVMCHILWQVCKCEKWKARKVLAVYVRIGIWEKPQLKSNQVYPTLVSPNCTYRENVRRQVPKDRQVGWPGAGKTVAWSEPPNSRRFTRTVCRTQFRLPVCYINQAEFKKGHQLHSSKRIVSTSLISSPALKHRLLYKHTGFQYHQYYHHQPWSATLALSSWTLPSLWAM